MNTIKEHVRVDCDLSFASFYSSLEQFKEKFGFLPDTLRIGLDNIDTTKTILRNIEPQDYDKFKDEIDLNFSFKLNEDFPSYYWEVSKIKNNTEYILYSNGA